MKLERFAGIALSLGLCMATGCCHKPTKTPFTAPPGLQPSYVEAGDELHWVASGQPFKISFFPVDPCEPTDNLVNSDGKTDIVCNVMTTAAGYYTYSYLAPDDKRGPQLGAPGAGYPMHVAPCTACTGTGSQSKGPSRIKEGAGQADLSTQDIEIYCSSGNPTVYPTSATANAVKFKFYGQLPQGSTDELFSIQVPANICSNYPAGTTLNTQSASCDLEKTYTFTVSDVYGCTSGSASTTLSPQ